MEYHKGVKILSETKDKSPSGRGKEKKSNEIIPEISIPLSQELKNYFGEGDMTDEVRHNLTMDMQRNLYGKGIYQLHSVFMELEGRMADISNVVRDRDDSTLEELIDTIAEEITLDGRTLRHILISMALKE